MSALPQEPVTGVASVTRLRPAHSFTDRVPTAEVQGELALCLDPAERPLSVLGRLEETEGVRSFANRFAQAVVEVMLGDRGVHQVMRWTSEQVYLELQERTRMLRLAVPPEQRVRRLRAQVRSVHVFRPADDVAELSVHVSHGQRSRAIAGRLEHQDGRWRCTVLEFG